ncbi:MAG: ABC transporter permease subunit, partial [Planctomycetota bacterium]
MTLRTLTLDPVMQKELFGVSRHFRTYLQRVVYVAILCLFLWLIWSSTVAATRYGSMSVSAVALAGRGLFWAFIIIQMIFVGGGGISLGCDLVTREVNRGTLGLLVLTPLSPWAIVTGKWKSVLAQIFLYVFCGLPVLAVCVYLRGAWLEEVLWFDLMALAYGALAAAMSIQASAGAPTAAAASMRSFFLLLVWTWAPFLTLLHSMEWRHYWCVIHPVFVMMFGTG